MALPLPASTQRWALVRSMSKTLGPDLRLAFIASDAATSAALRLRLNAGSQWVSHLLQDLTLACLTDEAFIASMTETRRHYRQQNEKLAAALARHGFSHATPGGWPQFLAAAASGEPALRLTPGPRRLAGPGGRGVWHPYALPRATPVAGPSE